MKRYLVFGGSLYPSGGMDDFIADFAFKDQTKSFVRFLETKLDWVNWHDVEEPMKSSWDGFDELLIEWKKEYYSSDVK